MVELNPKAEDGCYTTTEVAKMMQWSVRDLNFELNELEVIRKPEGSKKWIATESYVAHVQYREAKFTHTSGHVEVNKTLVWKPSGVELIKSLLE